MNRLFWKEYRQNRVVVILLLLMLGVPHLFGLFGMGYDWRQASRWHWSWQRLLQDWRQILAGASLYSFVISQVALAVIGGNVIAGERADRSAEFQVYLPLTRHKILAAKLLLVLAIAAMIWLINPFIIVYSTVPSAFGGIGENLPRLMLNAAITGLVFFCVAWFFSTILRSPTFSFAAGMLAPAIIVGLIGYGVHLILGEHALPRAEEWIFEFCYVCISLAVALSSFGVGTWLYLRRVEA